MLAVLAVMSDGSSAHVAARDLVAAKERGSSAGSVAEEDEDKDDEGDEDDEDDGDEGDADGKEAAREAEGEAEEETAGNDEYNADDELTVSDPSHIVRIWYPRRLTPTAASSLASNFRYRAQE